MDSYLIPVSAALTLAVFLLLQHSSIPKREQRTVLALVALLGSMGIPRYAPFDVKTHLFWLLLSLAGCVLLRVAWRRDTVLRQWWTLLDIAGVGAFLAAAVFSIGSAILNSSAGIKSGPKLIAAYLTIAAAVHLIHEVNQSNVLQRPSGLAFAQALAITSILAAIPYGIGRLTVGYFCVGLILLILRLRSFLLTSEQHRILERVSVLGQELQPEYTPPSLECPEPRLWSMYDSMTAEKEVLDLLYALVRVLKPKIAVETGTFSGSSSVYIARALKDNGRGRLITCEMDPIVHESACKRFAAEKLQTVIDCQLCSSFELKIREPIDFLYCDSDINIREQEVRSFIQQINPFGLILIHDAGSHFKAVREGAKRLEQEGLISVVFVSTPRGLVIAQKTSLKKIAEANKFAENLTVS